MSTDEYSQDLPEEMYMQGNPSIGYPDMGGNYSMPIPANMDMSQNMMQMPDQRQAGKCGPVAYIVGGERNVVVSQTFEQTLQSFRFNLFDSMADGSSSDGDTSGSIDLSNKRKYTRRKQPEERKKRGPRTKDANAPRMPPNGYVRFLNANRERVKQECPELTFADVTKKLGAEWTNMTSEEKKGYMEEAEKAKEIYMKELQEYQQTEAYQKFLDMKSLAKQQQPPTMTAPQMAPSQSQSPMSMPPGAMYSQQQQQQYYEQSGLSPNMHPNQYAAMYQQQQQQQQQMQEQQLQSYAYGMNGEGKSMGMPGGTYGQQQQQLPHQQYYPSSGHSSVASDFGSMSGGSSQYQSRFFQHYGNAPNGMQPYHMNAPAGNGTDMNGQMLIQGSDLSASNSLSSFLEKCNSIVDLPIFTEEFLEHNKMREQELRSTRAITAEYEEENAILSKHVDDMTAATERLMEEEAKESQNNSQLKAILEKLQHNLVEHFQDVNLPASYLPAGYQTKSEDMDDSSSPYCRPTAENIQYYVDGLDQFYAQSFGKGGEGCKADPLVQSIQKAITAIDEVPF